MAALVATRSRQPCEVDYVWGHGMLLRTSAVRETGALDSRFFMYFEDLDLCRRMRQAGWEIWCDARVTMSHRIDDASRAHGSQPWRWELKTDSARRFHRKHFKQPYAELLWCATTIREAVSLLRNGHLAATGHLLRAWSRTVRGAAPRGAP